MSEQILVVGGGVVGMALACEAAGRGYRVKVFDRGAIGSGASPVAAGMLTPLKEAHRADAFLDLGLAALRMYPEFVRKLEELAGHRVPMQTCGLLAIALNDQEAAMFQPLAARIPGSAWLSPREVLDMEPRVTDTILGALWLPSEGRVSSPRLMEALKAAAETLGVEIHEYEPVLRVRHDGRRAMGVETVRESYTGDRVVLAAGVWSRRIQGLDFDWMPAIRPVRGQILTLAVKGPNLRRILHGAGIYLVPESPGRLLVGATSEENSWKQAPDVRGLTALLNPAVRLIPAAVDFEFVRVRSGLRPAGEDLWPVLGPTPLDALELAVGHYRNGILLAPITAKLLCDAWESGRTPELMQPFTLGHPDRPRPESHLGSHPEAPSVHPPH